MRRWGTRLTAREKKPVRFRVYDYYYRTECLVLRSFVVKSIVWACWAY